MTHTFPRIGFCCKWLDHATHVNGIKSNDPVKLLNTKANTVRWLTENKTKADDKLLEIINHNFSATKIVLGRVATHPRSLRMMRLGSDLLPMYTHPSFRYFYADSTVRKEIAYQFAGIGQYARDNDIRLSFHPGQFCVLASSNDDIVNNSIEELEYHVDMACWMGYGNTWHSNGFKINVHISGARGAEGIIRILPRLSQATRNLVTFENEEIKWGLDETLKLENHTAIVLDIHHHWVKTGEYIQPNDDRVKRVIDSWRGVRPVLHYSTPRTEYVAAHLDSQGLPDYNAALAAGVKRASLRAHSDFYWCQATNDWAARFLPDFDIQAESKAKNLASSVLAQSLGLI